MPTYEFFCPKCPSSLWAHDDNLERLKELVRFHFKHSDHPNHPAHLTDEEVHDMIRELRHVPRLERAVAE